MAENIKEISIDLRGETSLDDSNSHKDIRQKITYEYTGIKLKVTGDASSSVCYITEQQDGSLTYWTDISFDEQGVWNKAINITYCRNSTIVARFKVNDALHTVLTLLIDPPRLDIESVLFCSKGAQDSNHTYVFSGESLKMRVTLSREVVQNENALLQYKAYIKEPGESGYSTVNGETKAFLSNKLELKPGNREVILSFAVPPNLSGAKIAVSFFLRSAVKLDESATQPTVRYYTGIARECQKIDKVYWSMKEELEPVLDAKSRVIGYKHSALRREICNNEDGFLHIHTKQMYGEKVKVSVYERDRTGDDALIISRDALILDNVACVVFSMQKLLPTLRSHRNAWFEGRNYDLVAKVEPANKGIKSQEGVAPLYLKKEEKSFTPAKSTIESIRKFIIGSSEEAKDEEEGKGCFCRRNQFYWGDKISCADRKKVLKVCAELWGEANKLERANELMAIMHLESLFNPKAKNGKGYFGLVQFSSDSAKAVGTTVDKLVEMDFVTQMDYVKKYIEYWANLKKINIASLTLVDLYLIVLKPSDVGKGLASDYAVFDESLSLTEEQKQTPSGWHYVTKYAYKSNPSFMKEKGEYEEKERVISGETTKKVIRGVTGGKTYIWEIDKEIVDRHKAPGRFTIFRGKCEDGQHNEDSPDGWYDPVKNPQITYFTQNGNENPRNQVFGLTRGRAHQGIDLFAMENTPVYACLSGKIVTSKVTKGGGNTLVLEISDSKQLEIFRKRKRAYKLAYDGEKTHGDGFAHNSDKIYFTYMHLDKIFLNVGMEVSAGTQVGTSGITGVRDGTKGPHLHFEIKSANVRGGLNDRVNPGFYIYYMSAEELKKEENTTLFEVQKARKNKGYYNK